MLFEGVESVGKILEKVINCIHLLVLYVFVWFNTEEESDRYDEAVEVYILSIQEFMNDWIR